MGLIFNQFDPTLQPLTFPGLWHLALGGFAFGAVFMATDPVTASRTETGKWIYGFFIGALAIIGPYSTSSYAEGMMLAILLMNIFCTID